MKIFFLFFMLFFLNINFVYATARARIPRDLEVEELNKDQERKFKNMYQADENELYNNQYKGPLKIKKPPSKTYFADLRPYLGIHFKYSIMEDPLKLEMKNIPDGYDTRFDSSKMNLKNSINYGGSLGLYWPNGIRIEAEYTQIMHTYPYKKMLNDNYAGESRETILGIPYNADQYIYEIDDFSQLEFKINALMFNLIFEKFNDRSRVVPYIGAGVGYAISDITNFNTSGKGDAPAYQMMVGLSYKFEANLSMYLGYKYFKMEKVTQTFKNRIISFTQTGSGASLTTTFTKTDIDESYDYSSHNIEFGARFFF